MPDFFLGAMDDEANDVLYAEMNLNDTDMLGVLAILEDCKRNNLDVTLELDGEFYALEEAIEIAEENFQLHFGDRICLDTNFLIASCLMLL